MAMQRENKKKSGTSPKVPDINSPTSLPVLLYAFIRVIVCTTNKATNSTINKTLLISINVSHFFYITLCYGFILYPPSQQISTKIKKNPQQIRTF